jgi:RNA polymerase sigma-70 factor (ECF subfamily)
MQLSGVLQRLRRAALLRDGGGMTDGQLLECYLAGRDEAAFAALVRRHGPMVLGVCRRVLGHAQDAEDAFQAAFLVLVRKAPSIKRRELLGNWLYGVAYRTALDARAAATRRRVREKQVSTMPEPEAESGQDVGRDLRPLLDQELNRLPDKYRMPVVLCDLEGRSREDVARQLGIPEGTLSGRLTTARRKLAERLTRRGLALSGGALVGPLSEGAASACLSAPLVTATVQAATAVAAGQAVATVVSAEVVVLTDGMVKAMLLNKLRTVTPVLLTVGLALGVGGFGVGLLYTYSSLGAARGGEQRDAPKVLPDEDTDRPRTDQERLQGTWEFVTVSQGGQTRRMAELKPQDAPMKTLTFTGNKVRFVALNGDGKEVAFDSRFQLNPAREPKEINLTDLDGKNKGETTTGLYELDGDSLKLCLPGRPGGDRPTAFESKKGSDQWLMVLRRVKEEKAEKPRRVVEGATSAGAPRILKLDARGRRVVWSPDGKMLAVVTKTEKTLLGFQYDRQGSAIRLWGVDKGEVRQTLAEDPGKGLAFQQVVFSADGKTIAATVSEEVRKPDSIMFRDVVKLWDAKTLVLKRTLGDDSQLVCVALSPDGKRVAAGDPGRKAVKLWNAETGKLERTLQTGEVQPWSVAVSSDGKTLLVGGQKGDHSGVVSLWNVETGKLNHTLERGQYVNKAVFSPNGKLVAGGGGGGDVDLWDAETGKPIASLRGLGEGTWSVAFSPDGKTLAAGGHDGKVRLWDLASGKITEPREMHDSAVYDLAFSPDGKTLASTSQDQTVRLWPISKRIDEKK